MAEPSAPGMLSGLRVLDLADDRGIFTGRILADLGADVVKVEPPGGDVARGLAPFWQDRPGIEHSLFWQLYAANKRSCVIDFASPAGRALVARLAGQADFLVESFRPGFMASIGLGYEALRAANPRLIYVSVSPFGQDGPYAGMDATDLTGMALGGFMWLTGDADRPPLRVSIPHFWSLGSAAAAAGAMVAHQARAASGEGQWVDASCQQAVARTLSHAPQFWDLNQVILTRQGPYRPLGAGKRLRINYPCADGYVNFIQPGGRSGGRNMAALVAWVGETNEGDPALEGVDFGGFGFGQIPDELLDAMERTLERFFAPRTKRELSEGAIARRVLLFPVNDAADLLTYPQLEARGFYRQVEGPEGEPMTTLGPWARASEAPLRVGRAPRLGEHTDDVLAGWCGLGPDDIGALRGQGVVA
jgi:crotonobetainyl-CoA:carnitine CoA-transferase CaiB-like acyl-CoA transferase